MADYSIVEKRGRSLYVRIPAGLAKRSGIKEGDRLRVVVDPRTVTLQRRVPKYRIEDLLDKMTPENQHERIDWGPPVGKEIW